MTYRLAIAGALMTFTALLAGCGGGTVEAVAPARQSHLNGIAPESGRYTLYKATGIDRDSEPTLERVWTVSLMNGQRIGFHWVVNKAHEWDPEGGYHLVAYAGDQSRDLGPFLERNVKYAWAGQGDDVMGYFHHRAVRQDLGMDQLTAD